MRDRELVAKICHYEDTVKQAVIDKLYDELERLAKSNRSLKNVMRIPRLYEKFRSALSQIEVDESQSAHVREKLVRAQLDNVK